MQKIYRLLLGAMLLCGVWGYDWQMVGTDAYSLESALQDSSASADNLKYIPGATTEEGDVNKRATGIIRLIITGLLGVAAAVAVVSLVISGLMLTVSLNDQDMVTKAKRGIVWSLGGLVLIIFSYVIVRTVIALTYVAG